MSRFSGFEKVVIAGSIIGAGIFLNKSYENFSVSDGRHPIYRDADDPYKMAHEAKQSVKYNLSYAMLCALPAVCAFGKREFRGICEDEEREKS